MDKLNPEAEFRIQEAKFSVQVVGANADEG